MPSLPADSLLGEKLLAQVGAWVDYFGSGGGRRDGQKPRAKGIFASPRGGSEKRGSSRAPWKPCCLGTPFPRSALFLLMSLWRTRRPVCLLANIAMVRKVCIRLSASLWVITPVQIRAGAYNSRCLSASSGWPDTGSGASRLFGWGRAN